MKSATSSPGKGNRADHGPIVYWLAVSLVIVGLLNVTPAIPGWDRLWQTMTGLEQFRSALSNRYLYPILFVWMMVIVALAHSIWRSFG